MHHVCDLNLLLLCIFSAKFLCNERVWFFFIFFRSSFMNEPFCSFLFSPLKNISTHGKLFFVIFKNYSDCTLMTHI